MSKTKKWQNSSNSLEAVKSVGSGFVDSFAHDVVKEGTNDFFAQLLGSDFLPFSNKMEKSGELFNASAVDKPRSGEVFNVSKHQSTEKPVHMEARMESGINYHSDVLKNSEKASRNELHEMDRQVREIISELTKLISSSKGLQAKFSQIMVEQTPPNIGEYHINFFEWMLSMLRMARKNVENSGAWLSSVKGKGDKKGYWGMFKKSGSSFGLSGERVVATQVG
jgi:hypothetical protein